MWQCAVILLSCLLICHANIINFEKSGAIPLLNTLEVQLKNAGVLNNTLANLKPGDTLLIPNTTFNLMGGVLVRNLFNVTIQLDGTLLFSDDRETWPTDADGQMLDCLTFLNIEKVTFTSSGKGTFDGNGKKWWGAIDFLRYQENRPKLLHMLVTKDILFENLLFKDSPFWTFWAEECNGLVVRYCDLDVRWDDFQKHTLLDLQAFNTDGFDVTGRNVYMHDLNIWNDDDCIAVKDGSENMLFERINASGLGLVIGSIGSSRVNNITFRDSVMHRTFKGIYMKTRWSDKGPIGDEASISNVLYENITINDPQQWGIWIGPAQQSGQPCPLYWPGLPGSECQMSGYQTWTNITLRDITINNPTRSPGVLIGNSSNPMTNIVFENVVINNPGRLPWGDDYYCAEGGMIATAVGSTWPVPKCFDAKTKTTGAAAAAVV